MIGEEEINNWLEHLKIKYKTGNPNQRRLPCGCLFLEENIHFYESSMPSKGHKSTIEYLDYIHSFEGCLNCKALTCIGCAQSNVEDRGVLCEKCFVPDME